MKEQHPSLPLKHTCCMHVTGNPQQSLYPLPTNAGCCNTYLIMSLANPFFFFFLGARKNFDQIFFVFPEKKNFWNLPYVVNNLLLWLFMRLLWCQIIIFTLPIFTKSLPNQLASLLAFPDSFSVRYFSYLVIISWSWTMLWWHGLSQTGGGKGKKPYRGGNNWLWNPTNSLLNPCRALA